MRDIRQTWDRISCHIDPLHLWSRSSQSPLPLAFFCNRTCLFGQKAFHCSNYLFHRRKVTLGLMLSTPIPSSERMKWEMAPNWLDQLLLAFVEEWYMNSLWTSWPEDLVTEVAGDRDSFQVHCLDVVFHVHMLCLFSANIANIDRSSAIILSWTFCHQRVDLFVELLYVSRVFICFSYC